MLYTGMDLHRRSIVVCTVNANGAIIARTSMKTEPDAVTAYFGNGATNPTTQQSNVRAIGIGCPSC